MARRALAVGVLWAVFAGCSDDPPEARAVPAPEGAVQPAGNGERIDEASACEAWSEAVTAAREELGCPAMDIECPAAIRPAGGACQAEYDQGSLDACRDLIGEYSACEDFDRRPCVVTAYLDTAVGCANGAGGSSGAPGAGGGGAAGAGG